MENNGVLKVAPNQQPLMFASSEGTHQAGPVIELV